MQRRLLLIALCLAVCYTSADDRTLVKGEYWFDNQLNDRTRVSIAADGQMDFKADASALGEGVHRLNYRAMDSYGSYSSTHTCLFYRVAAHARGRNSLEYWIDEGAHHTQTITEGETMEFIVDASTVSEGVHCLNYRLKNSELNHSTLHTWIFYRLMPKQTVENTTLAYWFDDGQKQTQTISGEEITLMADASSLDEGLHVLNYCVKYNDYQYSDIHSWRFYKTNIQPKATSLKWYRVWWNNHEDKAIEVQLPNGTAEYLYEETLAVPEYARNDDWSRDCTATFHVVFADDLGQLSPVESAVVLYPDIYPLRTKLTATLRADSISLQWIANKDNVRDYNVYYSENGEPYLLWKPNVTQTEATFRGRWGSTYRFLVTARDDKGNYEAMEESKAVKVELR